MKTRKTNSSKHVDDKVSNALLDICREWVRSGGLDPDKMRTDEWNNLLFLCVYAWNMSFVSSDKHAHLLQKFAEAYKGVFDEEVIQSGVANIEVMVKIKQRKFPDILKTIDRYELNESKGQFNLRVYSRDIVGFNK